MKISDFIAKLKLAHDVPNTYRNKFPYNCGYYDGKRFSFDCWNLIKAILGGWTDNRTKGYYASPKDFPTGDCDGYHLLMQCNQRSKDFSQLCKAGTYLYISDKGHEHAGIYVGDFQYQGETFNVVECTSDWASKVQYTYVDGKGQRFLYKGGRKGRSWTDWGILPYIEYEEESPVGLKTTFGIDISRYQKGMNLAQAKAEGVQFAVLKAGGADGGGSYAYYKDSAFESFYASACALGIPVGAYYFGHAFSVQDAVTEANQFISFLRGKDILHVWYDVEGGMLNQSKQNLTWIIKTFCDTMIQAGYVCGIYTSQSHFNSKFNDSELLIYPHWVACYSKNKPTLKSGALIEMWQYGGTDNYIRSNKIAGMVCDQDYCYFDIWNTPAPAQGYVINNYDYAPVFDPVFYADKYADLKSAFGNDASALWNHFQTFGMNEMRQASAQFNPVIYKNRYADLRDAYDKTEVLVNEQMFAFGKVFTTNNPLFYWHYIAIGKAEGRSAT